MNKIALTVLAALFMTTNIFSQSPKKFIDTGSVKNQFEYLVDESNNYQDYKVIKASWLLKLKSNIIDSLSASKKKISENSSIVNSQKQLIDSLNTKLASTETVISELKSEKESISLFGIQFEKTTFKTLIFLIIVGLIGGLLYFITKFKQSNIITTQSKLALKQAEEEFAIYKEKALEREQKAMRRLQDELNKNKKE
jgi:biopolymer transport protein ExbB/TolQ